MKSYPIVSAQLFKYKTYKSNNLEVLTKFKKQFSEYEITYKDSTSNGDTYEPTFEEYKELKEAFQGYFGIDEWNKVLAIEYEITGDDQLPLLILIVFYQFCQFLLDLSIFITEYYCSTSFYY